MRIQGVTHDVLPGWLSTFALSYRVLDGRGLAPLLIASVSLGFSLSGTHQQDLANPPTVALFSTDGRAGVTLGKTIARTVTPYVAARYFDLPMVWKIQDRTALGADAFLYQGAAGVAVTVKEWDVIVEVAPIGEGAATIAAGYAF